jgi:hypothetical protein
VGCRGVSSFCIKYSGWSITHTPHEYAGLARVLAVLGLDTIFLPGLCVWRSQQPASQPEELLVSMELARGSSKIQGSRQMPGADADAGTRRGAYFAAGLGLAAEP